ncbi:MAG: peptidoglycan-associated lipoprotein Pal [Pseudomonadota bacterium]
MKMLTRVALATTLAFALASGFGCAKKQVVTEPAPAPAQETIVIETGISEEQAAAAKAHAQQVITDTRVYFAFDKYDLSSEAKASLHEKAAIMKRYPSIRVLIAGNCDDRGTQEYNLALGERRARAALDYMVQLGVNPSQIEIISYGKERPLNDANTEAAWAKNRRDDFIVIR